MIYCSKASHRMPAFSLLYGKLVWPRVSPSIVRLRSPRGAACHRYTTGKVDHGRFLYDWIVAASFESSFIQSFTWNISSSIQKLRHSVLVTQPLQHRYANYNMRTYSSSRLSARRTTTWLLFRNSPRFRRGKHSVTVLVSEFSSLISVF